MPGNIQALPLIVLFILPGFVFVEVDSRRRPAQKREAFDKTVLSVLFSTILHAVLAWPILGCLLLARYDLAKLFDGQWMVTWSKEHTALAYTFVFFYFLLSIAIAVAFGVLVGKVTRSWTPVLSKVVRRDIANAVLVQMKNGDFYTGVLDQIPADYDVLQGPAKDFTIRPPGRYKPKEREWQTLQKGEVIVLNTANVDAIRIMPAARED